MKWILPLITASSVVSGATLTTEPQLNTAQLNTEPYVYLVSAEDQRFTTSDILWHSVEMKRAEEQAIYKANALAKVSETIRRAKEKQIAKYQSLLDAVNTAESYVGKTWYVFSGSSPAGWDCSGLVRWTYLQVGIELEHSATAQGKSGVAVKTPEVGDIVTFTWKGQRNAYHSGIYIGGNSVLHAGFKKGTQTEVLSLDSASFSTSKIKFRRVIDFPNQ